MSGGKLKLLIISTLYKPYEVGGAEITARMLAEGAARAGHEVTAISIAPEGTQREGMECGVKTIYLRAAAPGFPHRRKTKAGWATRAAWQVLDSFNPMMERRVSRVLRRERPDVVHCHNLQGFSVSAWRAARELNCPVIQTLHDYYLTCANSTMFRDGRNCARQCLPCYLLGTPKRWLSNTPVAVTSVSRFTLARLESCGLFRGVPAKSVIWNCNDEQPQPSRRCGKESGRLRIGFIGRLDRLKGIEILLQAAAVFPAGRVLIAGRGEAQYEQSLKAQAKDLNVEFLGFVEPALFYRSIDVLVVPSLWNEPLPRVIPEAMAYGVPVVCANLGGMPEIVLDGRTGFVFPPGDANELAKCIQRLEDRVLLDRMSANASAASAQFRFEAIYSAYENVWRAAHDRRVIRTI